MLAKKICTTLTVLASFWISRAYVTNYDWCRKLLLPQSDANADLLVGVRIVGKSAHEVLASLILQPGKSYVGVARCFINRLVTFLPHWSARGYHYVIYLLTPYPPPLCVFRASCRTWWVVITTQNGNPNTLPLEDFFWTEPDGTLALVLMNSLVQTSRIFITI